MISADLKPLLQRLNPTCTSALEAAAGLCVSKGAYEIAIEHLLLKLLEAPDTELLRLLNHFGVNDAHLRGQLQHAMEQERTGNARKPVFSQLLIEWFQEAWLLASLDYGATHVSSGVLFTVLVINPWRYGMDDIFGELRQISADELRRNLLDLTQGAGESAGASGGHSEASTPGFVSGDALGQYCISFTERARLGAIDPVFCRDAEIRQMVDILARRRKNNPIVVGEAGVGKTAVVEGLALKIVQQDVPEILQGVELLSLDMGLLQAGASVKGEFEKRLRAVISEIKSSTIPIILFIDEAHTLVGAGGQAGGSDAANLLKPVLARGEMRTVAATTWSEYKKYFEKDPALARRFQLVKIDEPSPEEAIVILRGLRSRYEDAHKVYIQDAAVVASANLAARYITGRQLPDKAVDLLDTACARVNVSRSSKPPRIDDLEKHIRLLQRELTAITRDLQIGAHKDDGTVKQLEQTISELQIEIAGLNTLWQQEKTLVKDITDLRQQLTGDAVSDVDSDTGVVAKDEKQLRDRLLQVEQQLATVQASTPLIHHEVTPATVGQVLEDWTGIPAGNMVRDEAKSILGFATDMAQRIIGQDQAIAAMDRRIRSARAGLGSPKAPLAVLLFVGPSGVGKTESALAMAELLFGGEEFVVSVNMSEFQEKHTVSRLIGSPPGYVGYGEGGVLTEAVRQRPYSVVLLDEVEKADPEVLNLFYQVFDKGELADGEGRKINFRNTAIILTSNLASDIIMANCNEQQWPSADILADMINPVLTKHFKPALLARMEVVPFYPLAQDKLRQIVAIKLRHLERRMWEQQKIKLQYDTSVVDAISARCVHLDTGARDIDHIVSRNLLPRIATGILESIGRETMPGKLIISMDDKGDFSFSFQE